TRQPLPTRAARPASPTPSCGGRPLRETAPPPDQTAMLRLRSEILRSVRRAGLGRLRRWLQEAIELEHATIPPYLTALYSIKPGYNQVVADILRSVVVQEMLHLTIAANVLNALGGAPVLDRPGFIPTYPGPLPMVHGDFTVGLEKLSRRLVRSTFLTIEEPERPLCFPVTPPEPTRLVVGPAGQR